MAVLKNRLTVFEHQLVRVNQQIGGFVFSPSVFKDLQEFYGEKGVPYFSLHHKSVQFCEYVGVIQVGRTTIEVLPKADRQENETSWRELLIDMIRTVGVFNVSAPSSSSLKVKHNSILDLYIELFITELEALLHRGLVKQYRKLDHQSPALKGSLLFSQHLQKNVVHKERFFVRNTVYDVRHLLHGIFYQAICLLERINKNAALASRIGALSLNFPEQTELRITEALFQKMVLTRKTEPYKNALEIARLLLLNYHPNVNKGRNHVLALMFDMNQLWEKFVYSALKAELRQLAPGFAVSAQTSLNFWKPGKGQSSTIRPDIRIRYGVKQEFCVVLDTKWKNLNGYNPTPEDLRQLYVYHEYFDAKKVALIYPGNFTARKGHYYEKNQVEGNKECSVMGIPVNLSVKRWRVAIANQVLSWIQQTA
jgi:5-methylcytosine-specific restriction enzyme subunit McrC